LLHICCTTGEIFRVNGFTGTSAYDRIFDHFGNRITSVNNSYISDNLTAFNKGFLESGSLEAAAKSTFDGRYLMSRGFNNVKVKPENPLPSGGFDDVSAVWSK
jgi:hypothetical protein